MTSDEVLVGVLREQTDALADVLLTDPDGRSGGAPPGVAEKLVDTVCRTIQAREFDPLDELADYLLTAAAQVQKMAAADRAVAWVNRAAEHIQAQVDVVENLSRDQRTQMHMRVRAIFSWATMRIAQQNLKRLLQ